MADCSSSIEEARKQTFHALQAKNDTVICSLVLKKKAKPIKSCLPEQSAKTLEQHFDRKFGFYKT